MGSWWKICSLEALSALLLHRWKLSSYMATAAACRGPWGRVAAVLLPGLGTGFVCVTGVGPSARVQP